MLQSHKLPVENASRGTVISSQCSVTQISAAQNPNRRAGHLCPPQLVRAAAAGSSVSHTQQQTGMSYAFPQAMQVKQLTRVRNCHHTWSQTSRGQASKSIACSRARSTRHVRCVGENWRNVMHLCICLLCDGKSTAAGPTSARICTCTCASFSHGTSSMVLPQLRKFCFGIESRLGTQTGSQVCYGM